MKNKITKLLIIFCLGAFAFSYSYSSIYTPKKSYNYKNGGQVYIQNGYYKSNGTYVAPHYKTRPDQYKWNNLSYGK